MCGWSYFIYRVQCSLFISRRRSGQRLQGVFVAARRGLQVRARREAAAVRPNSFHRRVFPTRIEGIRNDSTNQWNANASKNFALTERVKMQIRINALNVQNRSQMGGPSTDPFSTNFGRITSQTAATNRWMEAQTRITF